jgi:hypothetical protein
MRIKEVIINNFFAFLKETFDNDKFAGVYQVGSSVLNIKRSNDIDILLISNDSYSISYTSAIINLKNKIFHKDAINGAFDATDEKTKKLLNSYISKNNLGFKMEYAVGPLKKEFIGDENIAPNIVTFHICGPMKLSDYDIFFKEFPFHALAFTNFNKRIVGKELNKILEIPFISITDYQMWQHSNFGRLSLIPDDSKKIKVLKTMILTKFLFDKSRDAYVNAYNKLDELMIHYSELSVLIEKTCEFCGYHYG